MKPSSKSLFAIATACGLLASSAIALGQAAGAAAPATPPAAGGAAAARGGGGGGGGRGGGTPGTPGLGAPMPESGIYMTGLRPPTLNDLEITAITRWEFSIQKELTAQRAARTALNTAPFTTPANPADITAKVAALAKADLDVAMARAAGFGKLKTEIGNMTPERQRAMMQAIDPAAGGGGGGRGGG